MNSEELYSFDWANDKRDFCQKMGVADKSTLRKVVKKNYEIFEKYNQPVRHASFVVAVLKDMQDLGYKTRLNEILEFPSHLMKRTLDGD